MTAAIETEGLTRGFKPGLAVDGLTFSLEPGQVLALLGPNGAGKTTTVRLLDGVLLPHAGRSTVLGHDPAVDGDAIRRRTGVLTENAGLDDRLTSRENLLYVARLRGYGKAEALARVDELLERFGMGERARRPDRRLLHRPAQAGRPGPGPAPRPRAALPRRADLRARPGRNPRRHRP